MKTLPLRIFLPLIVLAWGLLNGCQAQPAGTQTTTPPLPEPTNSITAAPGGPESTEAPPTAVLGYQDEPPAQEPSPALPDAPTAQPDPLRFVFPTPRPAPVSAWRPPLYPVPWAPTMYDHFYFDRPIGADQVNAPLQDYRYGGDFFGDIIHTGVDIPAAPGVDVLAAGPGKIVWAGYGLYRGGYDESDPYGIAIAIRHDFGYQGQELYTMYGHLQQALVVVGQRVQSGEVIGRVGDTGFTTGPHLHFEVRVGDNTFFATRNPELWVAPPQGWGVLAGRLMDAAGRLLEQQAMIITANDGGQNWQARSYGKGAVYADPYYRENIVVGDLPAGRYRLRLSYAGVAYSSEVEIQPGRVTYFSFYVGEGFEFEPPPLPGVNFTPAPAVTPQNRP